MKRIPYITILKGKREELTAATTETCETVSSELSQSALNLQFYPQPNCYPL